MRRLTHDQALNFRPSLSADGGQLVYVSNRSGNFEVWRRDLATGVDAALTQTAMHETSATISRDGTQVAFGDGQDLYVTGVSGGTPKLLVKKHSRPYDWSLSGLVIGRDESGRAPSRLASWHPESGVRSIITDHASLITISPHLSPDGNWITFHTSDRVNRQVMVAPYDGSLIPESKWIHVTDGKALDREPRWSSDGKSVYFLSDRDGFRCVWARDLDSTKKPAGSIHPFVHLHSARLSLTHVPNSGHVSISSFGNKLILAIGELTGNIWITELRRE
jgi:Tol biopolymer transport system component